jgi:uncharacterized RmlC-like cupin family protein
MTALPHSWLNRGPRVSHGSLVAMASTVAGLILQPPAHAHPLLADSAPPASRVIGSPAAGGLVTVRPRSTSATRQGLRQFVGISGANSGATGLSMNEVIIPAGGRAQAHRHVGSESTIYLLSGTVKTLYGRCLEHSVVNRAGDFLFIPAGVPHQPINLSATQPAIAIVARNDPNEQEQVELLDLAGSGPAAGGSGCRPAPER